MGNVAVLALQIILWTFFVCYGWECQGQLSQVVFQCLFPP